MINRLKNNKGFTLIEVLLVVAIIAILAGIVILAINPQKQLAQSRNAQRRADVRTIIDALYQYGIDLKGVAGTLPSTPRDICATGSSDCSTSIDLSVLTVKGRYLVSIPKDPVLGDDTDTHYQISQDPVGKRVTVSAPGAELGESISATR